MNCQFAERQIFAERDGALDAEGQAALAAHVEGCTACRRTRHTLAEAVESLRIASQAVVVPDSEREWYALRRRVHTADPIQSQGVGRRRNLIPWLAVPLGAAAAVGFAFFGSPSSTTNPVREVARTSAVEVSAADGSVVFVDDKSGWVVVFEGDAGVKRI